MIAESMYSQCDPDGDEYILLDEIFDHRRTDTAIKLAEPESHARQRPDLPAALDHRLAFMQPVEGWFLLLGEPG